MNKENQIGKILKRYLGKITIKYDRHSYYSNVDTYMRTYNKNKKS